MSNWETFRGRGAWRFGASLSVLALALGVAAPAQAQDADDEIVVTGFRGSLAASLEVKRNATGFVDAITAEDIADFPDTNLAEAMQRVPGVTIDRDAGEGRSISVRGLGADFTRVRINGMETLTTTGATDSSGGANRGRGFDFNVFASELFSNVRVNKSGSASTEEGSLGATVDLRAPRPFDFDGPRFAASGQVGWNDLSEQSQGRASLLVSDTFANDRFGVLFSVAYSNRDLLEEGFSSVRWTDRPSLVAGTAAQQGFDASGADERTAPTPTTGALGGFDWEGAEFNAVPAEIAEANTAGNFFPRIPRYGRLTHEQDRLGITSSLQFRPSERTVLTFDFMYSDLDAFRQEDFLENFSFSRSAVQGGIGVVDVIDVDFAANGELIRGEFDDVWVRSESRQDELSTEFQQYVLSVEHDFTDRFRLRGMVGSAISDFENPIQTTFFVDSFVNGYVIDFGHDADAPDIDFGNVIDQTDGSTGAAFDATDPSVWQWRDNTGNVPRAEIRLRPQGTRNVFETAQLDFDFDVTDSFGLQFGGALKEFDFSSFEFRRVAGELSTPSSAVVDSIGGVPAITELLTGFGSGLGLGPNTATSWLRPNFSGLANAFDIYCDCVNAFGDFTLAPLNASNRAVSEEDVSYYGQLDWRLPLGGMTFRGDVGVRYVETEVAATGVFGSAATLVTVENSYDDTLPALNAVLEITDDIQVRFAAAKAMARPALPNLTPGGALNNVSAGGFSASIGNPLLDPFRADTYDLGFEWYFADESLVSVALFRKELESFVQLLTRQNVPFSSTGLDPSLNPFGDISGTVRQFVNTSGGDIEGYEVTYQQPFGFLPGLLANTGVVMNYTHVESKVSYFLNAAGTSTVEEDLTGLSPESWNATFYYEDDTLSGRVALNYRDAYLQVVPGRNGNALEGKTDILSVDASATYALSDNLMLTFEGINLGDEFNNQWVGSSDRSRESTSVYHHTGRQYYLGARLRF